MALDGAESNGDGFDPRIGVWVWGRGCTSFCLVYGMMRD